MHRVAPPVLMALHPIAVSRGLGGCGEHQLQGAAHRTTLWEPAALRADVPRRPAPQPEVGWGGGGLDKDGDGDRERVGWDEREWDRYEKKMEMGMG